MRLLTRQSRRILWQLTALLLVTVATPLLHADDAVRLMWDESQPQDSGQAGVASPSNDSPSNGSVESDLAELRARLDAVEQENRALSQRLATAVGGTATTSEMATQDGIQPTGAATDYNTGAVDYSNTGAFPSMADGAPCFDCAPCDPLAMPGKWNYGLEFQTADKNFRVKIGGRTQLDAIWLGDSDAFNGAGGVGDADAVDFRRSRIRIEGTMYEIVDFAVEYDFANSVNDNQGLQTPTESNVIGVTALTDLWLNIGKIPCIGNVRIGHMKEPIGMEHLTSSRWLEFIERSYNQDVFYGPFTNGWSPGIQMWNNYDDEHGLWATGFFKNSQNIFGFDTGDGEYAWTSRVTYLPWYDDESKGAYLMHIGASASLRDPDNDRVRYRARGSLRNGPGSLVPVFADTGSFITEDYGLVNAEAALNLGQLSFQGEYCGSFNKDSQTTTFTGLGNVFVDGWYVEALYFLTDDHRDYDKKQAVFTRVVPHQNFNWHCGCGAWQIGARYSNLNLIDGNLDGGALQDVTLGLNWFLNPNLKLQWNYCMTERESPAGQNGDGTIHGFGTRLAFDF